MFQHVKFTLFILLTYIVIGCSFSLNPKAPLIDNPSCIYFSGAGIYFWWQMGAAKYMKENCKPELLKSVPIIGAR